MLFLISLFFVPYAQAAIVSDLNCTTYNGTGFVYTPAAVVCSNLISDQACAALYPVATGASPPAAGTDNARPFSCFSTVTATPAAFVQDLKNAAIATCPKTCGYCCQTSDYACSNAAFPRLNCNTITNSQCLDINWRVIIAQDCPAACGLCNQGGCVDAVTSCANDIRICQTVGLESFVNTYCQKTCGRCPSTTSASSSVTSTSSTGTCTSYIADSSTQCAAWARNGFCTSTFYTSAQKRTRCATTCRIC